MAGIPLALACCLGSQMQWRRHSDLTVWRRSAYAIASILLTVLEPIIVGLTFAAA